MDTFKKQEALKPYFENSYGCAVFSSVGKAGTFLGVDFGMGLGLGAYGKGSVHKLPTEEKVGSVELKQASGGIAFGSEVYKEIIFFETEADFTRFVEGNVEFSADDAKMLGDKSEQYYKGMKVFTAGLMGGLIDKSTIIARQKFTVKMD